jgi:hypothetical protein
MKLLNGGRTHETNEKAVDQTGVKNIADFFRVHLLRGRDLIESEYLTPKAFAS